MKLTPGYAISLTLNVVLIALILLLWHAFKSVPVSTLGPAFPNPPAKPAVDAPVATITPVLRPPIEIGAGWQQWIDTLRNAGVPTDVLANLVRTDFDRRWQKREAEMQQKYLRGQADSDALAAFGLQHDADLDQEMREALGPDEFRRWDMNRVLQSLNVGQVQLSDTERNAVYDLERKLRDSLREAQADRLQGSIDQATLNAREQAEQDAVAQKLRALLGDQRAGQLQGADDTLGNLKRSLSTVPLSDDQLSALADVQRRWDQTRSQLAMAQNNTGDPHYADAIRKAEEKWRADFQQIAGPAAFEQYLKAQDSRYADLQKFAASWQISPSDIKGIFDTVGNYDEIAREYGLDAQARDADPNASHAALQQLQQETERTLQQRLGPDKYAELKRNGIVP
jgi:hypothetical protein